MDNKADSKITKSYLLVLLATMLLLPCISMSIECNIVKDQIPFIELMGKWFVFWAVGVRLFTAGLRQVMNPAFTAQSIFHISKESFIVVKELGFANICMGLLGILSIFLPAFRMGAAMVGGLYMAIAGINHIIKKPVSPNEWLAMVSDLFIGVVMGVYFAGTI